MMRVKGPPPTRPQAGQAGSKVQEVKIINRHKAYKINERLLKRVISQILKFCKNSEKTGFEFVFFDDNGIKVINKRYKGSGRPTDVLSFRINRKEFGSDKDLGEIFISIDRAFENSKIFGTEFSHEVVLYIIHGILHLFGYDDEDVKAKCRMMAKEREVLEYLCRKEDLSKVLMRR